jgi:hypothetical protein
VAEQAGGAGDSKWQVGGDRARGSDRRVLLVGFGRGILRLGNLARLIVMGTPVHFPWMQSFSKCRAAEDTPGIGGTITLPTACLPPGRVGFFPQPRTMRSCVFNYFPSPRMILFTSSRDAAYSVIVPRFAAPAALDLA